MEKLNPMAYWLNRPTKVEHVRNVFHTSQLRKYVLTPSHIIEAEPIEIVGNVAYEERPIQILYRRIKQLCNQSIPPVKVPWAKHTSDEVTS